MLTLFCLNFEDMPFFTGPKMNKNVMMFISFKQNADVFMLKLQGW